MFVRSMKKYRNILLLILLASVLSDALRAQSVQLSDPCEEEQELKILSWNIYMLPPIAPRKGRIERAGDIVNELKNKDYNIIVFQEAFHDKARGVISKGLSADYPYQYGPFNDKPGFKISSGIWIVSKLPLKELNTIEFRNCAGIDCACRKSAVLMEGELNGKTFQVLGTHLQSSEQQNIRFKQMDQIYMELLSVYKRDGVPQFLCGDMNTEGEIKERYCEMLNCFDAEDGTFASVEQHSYDADNNDLALSQGGKGKSLLDYILVRNNGVKMRTVKRYVNVLKRGRKHLSDHYGIVCEVRF